MNWIKTTLNDISIDVSYGYTASAQVDKCGPKFLRITDIVPYFIDYNTVPYCRIDDSKHEQYKLKKGDLLIARTGATTGYNYLFDDDIDAIFASYLIRYRLNSQKVIPKFIKYVLKSKNYMGFVNNYISGAAQPGINAPTLGSFSFLMPKEKFLQQKIAKILSNYDDLIENNNRRIKILEEMAQKIYKEWFVDFKFPGHETATIKETVLSSMITPIKGKNITKSKAKLGNVPVVGGGIEPAYYHNTANTQAPVITISASGANAGFVNLYYKNIWASDCSYIDTTMTNYIYYIYLLLKNKQIEITNMQLGAAQPHVYPRDLVNLKIKEFPIEVVVNFEKMVSPIFENIKVLSIKNENLKQTRDLLLPRLISGEIDVENMEIA